MSRGKKRVLTPEEQKLWNAVKTTAEPLHKTRSQSSASELALSQPKGTANAIDLTGLTDQKRANGVGSVNVDRMPELSDRFNGQPVRMDGKTFRKMKGGKLKPEGRIDLHGMTLDQAHPVLNRFIHEAFEDGKRLVLVITGKGKQRDEGGPIPSRLGVLRHQVPLWLAQGNLAPMVLQVTPASQNYGGAGAYFVYLRRRR